MQNSGGISRSIVPLLIALLCSTAAGQLAPPKLPVVRVTRIPIVEKIDTPKNDVEFTHFVDPKFPSLAQLANVTGDVVLQLGIHKDGSVGSVTVMSGNPMLSPAAMESAQHSQFECRGCREEITLTSLIYSFRLEAAPGWPCSGETNPRIARIRNRITVTSEPRMIDIYTTSLRVPSAKCLYLWECGRRSGEEDYYFFKVRSAKCLNLWSCGRRLREPWATCKKLHRPIW